MSRRPAPALRALLVTSAQLVLRRVLHLVAAVWPTTRQVLVSGYPETEGNAVEVARALLERYDGRVVWLREPAGPHADLPGHPRLVTVAKASPAGLWAYLRSEAVFFTHGLYGSPRPSSRKPLVNLWHGDGPKATRPGQGAGSLIPSTWLVSGTRLFGELKAAAFELPQERLLVTGNPRTDQLWRMPASPALAELGITAPFVLWMPTFRATKQGDGFRAWSEGGATIGVAEVRPLLDRLAARGVQLVVKPHPLDVEERRGPGVVTVTNEELARVGVPLYSLLGASAGLVTDYSSVWVDYLLLDRPMAFFVPDQETYARGLAPADVLEWLPGELVGGHAPFERFLADLEVDGRRDAWLRERVADRVGLHRSRRCADDLLDALERAGVLRLRPAPALRTS
ncbi:CDP-glycerol glycerophosphotransferase family protein [Nocardioides deserti]|uniref:CDP-glycerol glycerophosphotransferase family protein n=1 Tax=Nocardioides deserti TaxID=1588644 RepID=A0ABR6U780_9ACTN|nr:CDP-glycerol glycerophosphotransferase family protein [Nocardioides deserti]MBC2960289.1 CDP-glycerol glycerophosphotransferase family protein [Nocardioides deserti]GGO71839.1 teichoic acid biosynthesis protein [Nocardioides deserti]